MFHTKFGITAPDFLASLENVGWFSSEASSFAWGGRGAVLYCTRYLLCKSLEACFGFLLLLYL